MRTEMVTVVFDRKKTEERTGFGKVELRIYLSSKERKYFTLGKATSKTWKKIVADKQVQEDLKRYRKIIAAMEILEEPMTIEVFCNHAKLLNETETASKQDSKKSEQATEANVKPENDSDFITYLYETVEKENLKKDTLSQRYVFIRSIEEFGGFKTFSDLTPANILAYDAFLHKKGTRTDASIWGNYHKKMHRYIHLLLMSEKIVRDPYQSLSINKGKNAERNPLSEEELNLVRNVKLDDKLDRVRDLFVFSAFTGLAYIDVMNFDFEKTAEKVGDMYYISANRVKTGTHFFTPILDPAMAVLKKYNYQLPKISNQKLNDYLKLIQEALCIKKKMTYHVARHTFATFNLNHGVPMNTVAQMLGHTDIKVTQIYAKTLRSTIEHQATTINEYLRNKKTLLQ